MKHFFALIAGVAIAILLITDARAQSEDTSIKIKITKEVDGETKVFEKTYSSEEEMNNDPEYREFSGDHDYQFRFDGEDGEIQVFEFHKDGKPHSFKFHDNSGEYPHALHFDFDDEELRELSEEFRLRAEEHRESIERHLQELESKIKELEREDIREELAELRALLEEKRARTFHMSIDKKVSVEEVEGDEFGKKGKVDSSRELKLDGLNFFPNPSDGRFRLRFKLLEEGPLSIKVYSMDGKEVYSRSFERFGGIYSESIDLRGNEEGLYLMEIAQGKDRLTKKIVIKE